MYRDVIIINREYKELNPLICGCQECESSHSFGPASREYFLIHYIVSGKGTFKTKNGIYNLSKGNMFVIRPYEMTYYEADKTNPWSYIWIGFNIDIKSSLYAQASFLKSDILYSEYCERIFRDTLKSDSFANSKEVYLCSKLYEMFSILIEGEKTSESQNIPDIYVQKAKSYISANYMNNISVEAIATYLGINRRYFSSIFKKAAGMPPQQYIVNLRLQKAARLLKENGYTPKNAALSSGYQDIFNFSKMFKRKFGVSPLNYKNKYKE